MTKAADLDTVLPGTKKKGEPDAAALKTVARKTAEEDESAHCESASRTLPTITDPCAR